MKALYDDYGNTMEAFPEYALMEEYAISKKSKEKDKPEIICDNENRNDGYLDISKIYSIIRKKNAW